MKLLFVNACPRGEASRTLRLARVFLDEVRRLLPTVQVIEHDLTAMQLAPVDAALLTRKEALCDARAWNDALFAPAVQLQQADAVVIAAPYWDLSFPSILKIWVENMYVRNLTFYYKDDQPVGLCSGKKCVYLTTAGSPIGTNDFGSAYMQAVMRVFGVNGFETITAEALDLDSSDVDAIMAQACERAVLTARAIIKQLQEQE